MVYTVDNYEQDLAGDYGVGNPKERSILLSFFKGCKLSDITFTTSEDGGEEDFNEVQKICESLKLLTPVKKEIIIDFIGYNFYEVGGVKVVMSNYPFDILFIRVEDKEKFEKLAKVI